MHNYVHHEMARTFAWTLATQMLGSYFEDCKDRDSKDHHLTSSTPTSGQKEELCEYTVYVPYMAVGGLVICALMILAVVGVWLSRGIRNKFQHRKKHSELWKLTVIFLCMLETVHFVIGVGIISDIDRIARTTLKETMELYFQKMPYSRWDLTQIVVS